MVDKILEERGNRYGEFDEHARITQSIKETMQSGCSWDNCTDSQKEALEMIAHKIGRIVNGDPSYDDSWTDIVGYTQLVVNEFGPVKGDCDECQEEEMVDTLGLRNKTIRVGVDFGLNNDSVDAMRYMLKQLDKLEEKKSKIYPRTEYSITGDIAVSVLSKDRNYIVLYDNEKEQEDSKNQGDYGEDLPTMNWSRRKPRTKKGE